MVLATLIPLAGLAGMGQFREKVGVALGCCDTANLLLWAGSRGSRTQGGWDLWGVGS